MADKPGLEDLINSVVGSITMTSSVQEAVGKLQIDALTAASTVTSDLIKTNVPSPDIAAENLKIQQAVTEKTIAAIKALGPKDDSSSGSGA